MNEKPWKPLYLTGGLFGALVVVATVADIVIGSLGGGDLDRIPSTALGRFTQFGQNPWLGLYHLDLLNVSITLISVPVFVAVAAALRRVNPAGALFSLVFFLLGAAVFVGTNTALPMLDLSRKFLRAPTEEEKAMFLAAGEALLARGIHGGPGVFLGFMTSSLASLLLSVAMLRGGVFRPAIGVLGIVGYSLLTAYVVAVTWVPGIQSVAMVAAAPGGILAIVWQIRVAHRLIQLEGRTA